MHIILVASGIGRLGSVLAAVLVIAAAAAVLVRFAVRSFRSLARGCGSCHGAGECPPSVPGDGQVQGSAACLPSACAGCPSAENCSAGRRRRTP